MPDVREATLDAPALEALLVDIETLTQLLDVQVKAALTTHGEAQPLTARGAAERLLSGEVRAVQIRYRYQGREYWDTLLRTQRGVRLVRVDHGQVLAAASDEDASTK